MDTILSICMLVALSSTATPVEGVGSFIRSGPCDWGYGEADGPANWGSLPNCAEICGNGQRQSPIDLQIDGSSELVKTAIEFSDSYTTTPMNGKFKNNGHTVQFSATMPNTYTITGGPLGAETYQFLQLHFHWGSDNTKGSEHTIRGKKYPMEVHLVHINSKYVNSETGELDLGYASNADGLAVIGFMFKIKKRQDVASMTKFTDGIDALDGLAVNTEIAMTGVNLGTFTSRVMKGGYYNYLGSLTTPGCNEVVTWINAKKFLKISEAQLVKFRSTGIEDNFRPPQPLNGRQAKKGLSTFAISRL